MVWYLKIGVNSLILTSFVNTGSNGKESKQSKSKQKSDSADRSSGGGNVQWSYPTNSSTLNLESTRKNGSQDKKNSEGSNSFNNKSEENEIYQTSKGQSPESEHDRISLEPSKCYSYLTFWCLDQSQKASRTNNMYPQEVTKILYDWLNDHMYYPYPTEAERLELCEQTGLSRKQLRIWLINARKVSYYLHSF